MLVLGLTGSIAMGKSTAAETFRSLAVPVLDADLAVHRLLAPGGAAVEPVIRAFPGCDDGRGGVDRRRLGQRVFEDPAALARLEAIVHPLVRAAQRRFLARCAADGGRWWCWTSRCSSRPAPSAWSTRWPWSARPFSSSASGCCAGPA